MAGERKPAQVYFCVPFHWYYAFTAGTLPTEALFYNADPAHEAVPTAIAVPGTDLEYRIERLHLTVNANSAVTITDAAAGNVVWGPHTIPAGFAVLSFGESWDKSRTGMACGQNKAPVVTISAGDGLIEVFGFKVPAK